MGEISLKSSVEDLQRSLHCEWPAIAAGARNARETQGLLRRRLDGLDSEDTSIVVFGSLAREEFTAGSDLDWTLLIDGHSDPQHLSAAQDVTRRLEEDRFLGPGREGTFGRMAFSHNIIHQIGGEDDTNRNITQRILLLLESIPVAQRIAYDRVVRNILQRYLLEDRGLWYGSKAHKIPRFLLNDIVRYWRTVAVDFAYKQRERAGKGFALRNAKLRMSRKLVFLAGLLTCFGCHLYLPENIKASIFGPKPNPAPLIDHLLRYVEATPLGILAYELLEQPHPAAARDLFDAYDHFLALLADPDSRDRLESLTFDELQGDPIFRQVRQIGGQFEKGLQQLFFDPRSRLYELTIRYGVF